MVRSGTAGSIVVPSLVESFAVLLCPPPLTVAVFVTLEAAFDATFTVRVMAGKVPPPPLTTAVLVQVTVGDAMLQLQPFPVALVGVRPAGRVSDTVTVAPVVAALPTFVTVSV